MLSFRIDTLEISVYLSILLRISLTVFMIPFIGNARYPASARACVVVALSAMLFPILKKVVTPLPFEPALLLLTVVEEILFAMVISFSILILLAAFYMAGELISYLTGLGFVQVVDPQSGAQTTVVSNILQLLAVLLLFGFNGHHILLKIIVDSFHTVPIGSFTFPSATFTSMMVLLARLFVIAIKLAAPVMAVLLLSQVGLGLIAKFVPNINILVTSFPLTILLGLIFIELSLPFWSSSMSHFFQETARFLQSLVEPGSAIK